MKPYAFGVDIGGTTVKLGLFRTEGTLLESWEIPTRKQENGRYILKDIALAICGKLAERNISSDEVAGIGLGVPGSVTDSGIVNKCVNLGWGVVDAAGELRELTGLPVKPGNDANVAALGEVYKGGGSKYSSIVLVTLGTGVGGGVVLDGCIVNGSSGGAGEIGHLPMREDEPEICSCGKRGCLEQYCSANGLVRVTKQRLAREPETETVLRTIPNLTARDICKAAEAGDAAALREIDELARMLARALACVAGVINPQAFVIGGGMSRAGELLLTPLRRYFAQYVFHACADVCFEQAALGNEAGIYGGLRMVQQSFADE